ncbi:thiol peroxidase [Riemerella anatipestifer]|uniref:Thiol peroxidase n=1 Tax=Riemerella anatipestifer (strain ATCC 11845 / DSM 15868 / JCM 9532 / NCTC 11014) TaxID=693978 RepID=E4T9X5_RIEAD|nr:thiol peroxidase [Riemerella anatipestifer]ADQ81872.1 thiol peroxidase (atypical 2-Cys peroxiredoxin) [Riemerella anatipestifer ATCC 11845 = DSM 15868]ADZ12626.1 Peroxiredoxin [Riemerella anatipestifer RA-GD]AFD55879.1 thiol peroxidase (atypical 2-cys peroxiredoxin) [Riemerella anatipestifer ATCC 11845 = DSM 15868]AGC40214.1 Peroxiredoxin [Riemerella anatipestifer RA-CH-2]AKP69111.1 thiol peroxidase (atypical 2-cys peroxiredoxin) [Riemerella anatipestifer]
MAKLTLKGNEISSVGELPKLGETIKDFNLVASDLSEKTKNDFSGKRKVLNIFPSIDTGVCAASARKFNEEASKLDNTIVINISRDLPFALGRFCAAEGLNNVETLSDFRSDFGEEFGVTLLDSPLKGLLSRAVVITDENDKVIYTEQVSEITNEPNYEAALASLK